MKFFHESHGCSLAVDIVARELGVPLEIVWVDMQRKVLPDGTDDTIIVVANLDPHHNQASWFHLNMPELGLGWDDSFPAHDLVTGATWHWSQHNWSWLGPDNEPIHIVQVGRY